MVTLHNGQFVTSLRLPVPAPTNLPTQYMTLRMIIASSIYKPDSCPTVTLQLLSSDLWLTVTSYLLTSNQSKTRSLLISKLERTWNAVRRLWLVASLRLCCHELRPGLQMQWTLVGTPPFSQWTTASPIRTCWPCMLNYCVRVCTRSGWSICKKTIPLSLIDVTIVICGKKSNQLIKQASYWRRNRRLLGKVQSAD